MIEWIVSSSALILFISAIRFLFRNRLALRARYALWLLVAIRLLVPASFWESSFSILNLLEIGEMAMEPEEPPRLTETDSRVFLAAGIAGSRAGMDGNGGGVWNQGSGAADFYIGQQNSDEGNEGGMAGIQGDGHIGDVAGIQGESNEGGMAGIGGKEADVWTRDLGKGSLKGLLTWIWLAGIVLCTAIVAAGNSNYRRRLHRTRKPCNFPVDSELPVYMSPLVTIPCLFGLVAPAIYLNSGAIREPQALGYVLSHENTHYRHRDNLWALVRTACVCVHWYNPLVWLAAGLSRQDCELACDEEVLGKLGEKERIAYGRALLEFSVQENGMPGSLQAVLTISGRKKQLKERLMIIVQKPKRNAGAFAWTLILALLGSMVTFTGKMDAWASDENGMGEFDVPDQDGDENGKGGASDGVKDGQIQHYVRSVSIDLGDGKDYVLEIGSESIPGTGEYQTSQVALCRVKDSGEEELQTIRAGDAKVFYTKPMSAAEAFPNGGTGIPWYFSPEGEALFAKPLRSLEDLPGQASGAFLEGSSGEMWAYAPDGGILVEDLNFDGYDDICLQAGVGSVNIPYYCWLWNPAEGRFVHSYMIPNVKVNEETQLLESVTKDGEGVYSIKYYRFDQGNNLHLVRYVEENQLPDAVFPLLDLTYCEDIYYDVLPAVDNWDVAAEYGGALTERLIYWAKQALIELYEWSGTKINTTFFTATDFGSFYFGNSPADVRSSRVFYSRTFGARAGFRDCIESMDVSTERTVWYSQVIQWNVPDNLRDMTNFQVAEWYFERSALTKGEKVADIEESYEDAYVIKAESGRYYEISLHPSTREASSVYGPYDSYPTH